MRGVGEEIDYIGISGFHQKQRPYIWFPRGSVINPLETMGYLGTVGVMECSKLHKQRVSKEVAQC